MNLRSTGLLVLLAASAGCSLTTATGFKECDSDLECGSGAACSLGYCLPMPAHCRRVEGPFERSGLTRLAALLPLTAGDAGQGVDPLEQNSLNGMALAVREVNGQVSELRFALYACDTRGDAALTAASIEWAVGQMQVPALLTSGNAATRAAALNSERRDAGALVVSPNASSDALVALYAADHSIFRVAPPDALQATVLAQLMTGDSLYLNRNRVAVVFESGDDRDLLAGGVRTRLATAGRDARPFSFTSPIASSTVTAQLNADLKPTASVLIGSNANVRALLTQAALTDGLRASDGHRWLFSSSSRESAAFASPAASREAEGMLGASPNAGTGPLASAFRARFNAAFGTEPTTARSSYDAAFVVMLSAAWRAADKQPLAGARMSEGLANLSSDGGAPIRLTPEDWAAAVTRFTAGKPLSVEGVTGKLEFDSSTGATASIFEVWRVTDGGFTTVRFIRP